MRISSAAILIIICISLVAGVVSWFIMSKKSRIGNYLTAKVIRGNIENTVTAVGVLQPFYYVDVGAQVTGQLKTLKVKAGDSVKKGQLLAEIDPIIFQA
ncbi:MAG: biotin/lipoyl-binding protein, partial [Candidatus Brocadia sinica]|nr:biotin/lipoyl-binding protein [Candidatus Brocadia sinica]